MAHLQELIKYFYVCVALKLWWHSDYSSTVIDPIDYFLGFAWVFEWEDGWALLRCDFTVYSVWLH